MIKDDYFRLIEEAGSRGLRACDVAEHTGDNIRSVTNWLSRWEKYGYLVKFKVDPDKLSSYDRMLYEKEAEKERSERWNASHRLNDPVPKCGGYKYSRYRYKIDGTCKEWGNLRFGDHNEEFNI